MVGVAAVSAAAALGPASTAEAAGATQIDGIGVAVASCDGLTDAFTMELTGALEGCWYNHGWDVVIDAPSGAYFERGTETFVGCLVQGGERTCGSFSTTYFFQGAYTPDGQEVRGHCQHPIVEGSGTGGFAGVTGVLQMKDDVSTGEVFYRGHLRFG